MNSTRMRRLLWRTGFMMFCPNEKKASEYEPEKRGPLKGLFHAASSAGVPWASYSIQPWLLYEPFSPMPCPSCYTDHHFSCKTGILSLESFSRGIYILSSTSSKPFPPFTRNWTPQRTFIMIFIGLFRAGYRGKGSRDRGFNSLLLSALHPHSSALAHLNSRDQTAQTPSDP